MKWQLPVKKKYWISCNNITGQVDVDGLNRIVNAPPVLKKFIDQPFENLEKWFKRLGGFQKEEI